MLSLIASVPLGRAGSHKIEFDYNNISHTFYCSIIDSIIISKSQNSTIIFKGVQTAAGVTAIFLVDEDEPKTKVTNIIHSNLSDA